MPRPYGLLFEQGPTGRNGRLAGLGDTAYTVQASDGNSVDLTTLYPAPAAAYNQPDWWRQGTVSSPYPTSISSLFSGSNTLLWLGGGLIVGLLLFRR